MTIFSTNQKSQNSLKCLFNLLPKRIDFRSSFKTLFVRGKHSSIYNFKVSMSILISLELQEIARAYFKFPQTFASFDTHVHPNYKSIKGYNAL